MRIIGISGRSGSGKTSLIREIRSEFSEDDVCILSLDNYYRNREDQDKDELGYYNFDLMTSFEWDRVVDDIHLLINGEVLFQKQYIFNKEEEPQIIQYKPAQILIIEGIFVLAEPRIWDLLDYSIIIDAEIDTCRQRRLARDVKERNYDPIEILHRFDNHVLPSFKTLIEPLKSKVDEVMINQGEIVEVRKKLIERVMTFLD